MENVSEAKVSVSEFGNEVLFVGEDEAAIFEWRAVDKLVYCVSSITKT